MERDGVSPLRCSPKMHMMGLAGAWDTRDEEEGGMEGDTHMFYLGHKGEEHNLLRWRKEFGSEGGKPFLEFHFGNAEFEMPPETSK